MPACSMKRLGIVVLLSFLLSACIYDPPEPLGRSDVDDVVKNWLRCDECWNRQYQHVVMMGDQAVPVLLDYLDNTAPPLVSDAVLSDRYAAAYDRMVQHLNDRSVAALAETKFEYVNRHKAQFRNAIRARAAIAIAKIDSSALPADWAGARPRTLVDP